MNVVELIVKNDYCIGCGVCAGVCPSDNLTMDWSDKGELNPYSKDICKENCSICLDICPFNNHEVNQDDIASLLFSKIDKINYHEYTGYYLDCFIGSTNDEEKRLKSASGGLATSFLSTLLEKNVVDKIVAVGIFEKRTDRMFDFKILNTPEEVYSSAGSAYYPVEISEVLKQILKEKDETTYAIVALPCSVYGLRLAMEKMPKLKKKIKIIASLTCGQLQNRFCTEILALESGIKVEDLSKMDFRRKAENNVASNYIQIAFDKEGNEGIPQYNHELPFHLWYYQYFKHNACNICDDIFGELADVTFMDAWLPEYMNTYQGTSVIISRNPTISKLLKDSEKDSLENISIQKVVESQMGVIERKRVLLKGRIYKYASTNPFYPEKRVKPDAEIYNENKEFIDLTYETQILSKKVWPHYRLDQTTANFWKELKDNELRIKEFKNKVSGNKESKKESSVKEKKKNNRIKSLFKKIIKN